MSDQKLTIGNTPLSSSIDGTELIWIWKGGRLLSTKLTSIQSLYSQTIVSTSPYNALTTDQDILVYMTISGACTINLPSAAGMQGYNLFIKDAKGIAATYNLTVSAFAGDVFEGGASTFVYRTNFEGHLFTPAFLGFNWTWVVKT